MVFNVNMAEAQERPIDFSQPTTADKYRPAKNSINFELMDGTRTGSTFLYSTDEQMFYIKQHVLKEYTVYRCKEKSCASKIWMKPDSTCVKAATWVNHNHFDMSAMYESLLFRNKMKEASLRATIPGNKHVVHTVYRQIVEQ